MNAARSVMREAAGARRARAAAAGRRSRWPRRAACRREPRPLPRLQRLVVGADGDAATPLQHDVDLVLVVVRVDILALARLERVEVQQDARGGGQRDLGHSVGLELRTLAQADLHDALPKADRASSVTG